MGEAWLVDGEASVVMMAMISSNRLRRSAERDFGPATEFVMWWRSEAATSTSPRLHERDIFDLFLLEIDKPWVIHLRENLLLFYKPLLLRPNTVCERRGNETSSTFLGAVAGRKGQHKDYLDACSEGSFTSKEVESRWDLLDRIEDNAEGWENDKGYADKPPFKPLPPKEGNEEKEEKKKKKGTKKKKKKKKENKKKEVTAYPRVNEITLSNRKYVAPNDYCDNESEYDDLPMPFTYISNHDLNEHTTFDIANLWEINSENDDDNDCHSVSAIHASSHNDIESSKLGEEVFANPLATGHYVLDTSPSNNNNGVDTDKPIVKDNYSISYDDTVPPISDDHYKECYDIDNSENYANLRE
ncbi:hypothetical protein QYE76_016315 [Lolium multiflorum]|uniref:Uncharacterized protein n=1 Tax=Lolium multiflorum TaxID=4521 RepID=A0AAD8X785_LOLMU|nr:hypothetical protein QYE76_016315 [Lolium multiflorum]